MAGSSVSGWYSTAYECKEDPSKSHGVGFYWQGQLISTSPTNPTTGKPWTIADVSGETPTGGTTPTGQAAIEGEAPPSMPNYQEWLNTNYPGATPEELTGVHQEYVDWITSQGGTIGATALTPPTMPTTTPTTPAALPAFGETGIPTAEVTPAPAYEMSPEEKAWREEYSTKLTDWAKEGYGIPEETQAKMIQIQTDALKAREQENIRVMKNNMERRGITNSGYVQANENQIHANTTVAIAGAITDVQIKSELMRMESFERAMGASAQFLGYLSEQSQLKYAPGFATWTAEGIAKLQAWQAEVDVMKMAINQAYQTQNIELTGQIQSELAEQTHGYNVELAEMEIEMNQEIAKAEGAGNLLGTASGAAVSLIKPS